MTIYDSLLSLGFTPDEATHMMNTAGLIRLPTTGDIIGSSLSLINLQLVTMQSIAGDKKFTNDHTSPDSACP